MALAVLRKSQGAQRFLFSEKPAVLRRTIRTWVLWDIDDCRIPKGVDPFSIAGNITDALANLDYGGPVNFFAYGDMFLIDSKVKQALSDTGISLNNSYAFEDTKRSISVQIGSDFRSRTRTWGTWDYLEPANCLLISSDGSLIHGLGERCNILLAKPRKVARALEAEARVIWRWRSLVAGGPPEKINQ